MQVYDIFILNNYIGFEVDTCFTIHNSVITFVAEKRNFINKNEKIELDSYNQ